MRNYLLALAFVSRLALSDSGRTNEAQEALILDPAAECSPYDYPPVDAVVRVEFTRDLDFLDFTFLIQFGCKVADSYLIRLVDIPLFGLLQI